MRLKSKTQKGSVLLAVIVVSMMMMVIVSAGISMVGHTQNRTNREYREKQAYFLASSSLKGFVSEVTRYGDGGSATEVAANIAMVKGLIGQETNVQIVYTGGGSNEPLKDAYPRLNYGTAADNTCNCKIRIERNGPGDDSLKAIATANYLGEEAQVVAYFSIANPVLSGSLNNALEFIGTTGGKESSYNNLTVLGNTGAISKESHDENILYKFSDNDCRKHGTADILGSLAVATQWQLQSNYAYKSGDPIEEAGCVLKVSRSALFVKNEGRVVPTVTKMRDYTGKATYNYIDVGEALVVSGNYGSGSPFCGSKDHEVDIYCSGLVLGGNYSSHHKFAEQSTKKGLDGSFGSDPAALKQVVNLKGVSEGTTDIYSSGNGNDVYIYGNVYTYSAGDFHGDVSINGKAYIYGDLYCSGKIYLAGELHFPIPGTGIHFMTGTDSGAMEIKQTGPPGPTRIFFGEDSPSSADKDTLEWNEFDLTKDKTKRHVTVENWVGNPPNDRARRPASNTTTAQEYLHEPESFFVAEMGSNLDEEYKRMYKSTTPGTPESLQLKGPSEIPYVTTGADASFRNDGTKTFEAGGNTYKPIFYVDDSFVLGNYSQPTDASYTSGLDHILYIDVQAAGKDICVLMMNGGKFDTSNDMKIVINNPINPATGQYDHFVYFCTDSGVGEVNPMVVPANTKTDIAYDTFRPNPTYRFDTKSLSYCVTKELFGAIVAGKTEDYVPGDSSVYMFVGNGGLVEIRDNNFVFEGTIYAPKASVHIQKGYSMTINHYDASSHLYAVLGAVMCKNFLNDGNLSTIAYEPAAPNSLLPKIVKSEDMYDTGFKLSQYKAT